jgi:putative ABC transport system permease protein
VIALQFLSEALLLSGFGGCLGAGLGILASAGYSAARGWPILVSAPITLAGIAGALTVGTVGGIYPATRAAQRSPAEALRSV